MDRFTTIVRTQLDDQGSLQTPVEDQPDDLFEHTRKVITNNLFGSSDLPEGLC